MITDLFIKTCAKDRVWLEFCLKSIDRHANGFRQIVVVTDPDGPARISTHTSTTWSIVRSPPDVRPRDGLPAGYWWQQAVKLAWQDFTDADAVVITDSDCIFTTPVSPDTWHKDGKPIWFVRPWEAAGPGRIWKPSVDHFLGYASPACHMCRNGFLLTREATVGFLAFMHRRFGQTPWEYVLDRRHVKPTEFQFFGGYLATVERHGYEFVRPDEVPNWPLHQFWSWGGVTTDVRKVLEEAGR